MKFNAKCFIVLIKRCTITSFLWIFVSCSNNHTKSQYKSISSISHNGVKVELFKAATKGKNLSPRLVLRVSHAGLKPEMLSYLSFRIDPVLSSDIYWIAGNDTTKPQSTLVERAYEFSREDIFVMSFEDKVRFKRGGQLKINGFLGPLDTLIMKTKSLEYNLNKYLSLASKVL